MMIPPRSPRANAYADQAAEPGRPGARRGYAQRHLTRYTAHGDHVREAVNHWIRTSSAFDAVADFDAVPRDPQDPARMLPAYDSGDHLHPNDAGYQAAVDSIDLQLVSSLAKR